MFPALTNSLPNLFTPKRLEALSLPFEGSGEGVIPKEWAKAYVFPLKYLARNDEDALATAKFTLSAR